MNDLEINKALAEIEGIAVRQAGSTVRAFLLIVDNSDTKDSVWEPLLNDGQAFRLLQKHLNNWNNKGGVHVASWYDTWLKAGPKASDLHRAICLAVLAKEGIE